MVPLVGVGVKSGPNSWTRLFKLSVDFHLERIY